MASVNSPLNRAIGLSIKELRETRCVALEECARRLRVSPTYLRTIESGNAALPVYAIHGIVWEFGANFLSVSGLLSLADYLDVREKGSATRSSDLQEIKERIMQILLEEESLEKKGAPQLVEPYGRLLRKASEAIDACLAASKDSDAEGTYERSIEGLKDIVDELLSEGNADFGKRIPKRDNQTLRGLAPYDLSPVFEDVLDAFAARLALFPPHIDSSSFKKWEEKNSERIVKIYAYHSFPEEFIKDASRYNWAFLWNQHQAKVKILISPEKATLADSLERQLRAVIRRIQPRSGKSVSNNVAIQAITSRQMKQCEEGLMFDFVMRKMLGPEEKEISQKTALDKQRYKRFWNAWLYELRADALDSHDKRIHQIGFLDTYQKELASAYAVGLSSEDVKYWKKTFDEICK